MASAKLLEIMKQAESLTPDEQLQLASRLVEKARHAYGEPEHKRNLKWRDIYGSAPYPLAGEDAQAWVSRTRQESEREFDHNIQGQK